MAALHMERFECADAVTMNSSFVSDRNRPPWELSLFLLPKRPKIRFIAKIPLAAHAPIWSQHLRLQSA